MLKFNYNILFLNNIFFDDQKIPKNSKRSQNLKLFNLMVHSYNDMLTHQQWRTHTHRGEIEEN